MPDLTSDPLPSSELLAQKALAAQQVSELNRAMMRLGPAGVLDAAFKIQSPRGRSGARPMAPGLIGAPNDQNAPPVPEMPITPQQASSTPPAASVDDLGQLLSAWYKSRYPASAK